MTARVRDEQYDTAPDHCRDAFRVAARDGWIRIVRGAHERDIQRIQDEFDALSDTDAELVVLASREGYDVFTDDRDLLAACRSRGVRGLDVADTLALLAELGALEPTALQAIVDEMSKERAFTVDDFTLLGLRR